MKEKLTKEKFQNINRMIPDFYYEENMRFEDLYNTAKYLQAELSKYDLENVSYSQYLSHFHIFDYDFIINNPHLFIIRNVNYDDLSKLLGEERLKKLVDLIPEYMLYIIDGHLSNYFISYIEKNSKLLKIEVKEENKDKIVKLIQTFFKEHNRLKYGYPQLYLYNSSLFPLDKSQKEVVDAFGIENIRKFNNENNLFFGNSQDSFGIMGLDYFEDLISKVPLKKLKEEFNIDFKNGTLSYGDFKNELSKCIEASLKYNYLLKKNYVNFDTLNPSFRKEHKDIFLSEDAPEYLKEAYYYDHLVDSEFIANHRECIKYLIDKNLANVINCQIKLSVLEVNNDTGRGRHVQKDFVECYVKRYGNEKLLELFAKYGSFMKKLVITCDNNEFDDEKLIEKQIRAAIYKEINDSSLGYRSLANNKEFVEEYPEIFVDFSSLSESSPNILKEEIRLLTTKFYQGDISYDDIKRHPGLIPLLRDKNLRFAFYRYDENDDLRLIEKIGNKKFLILCSKYGRYLKGIGRESFLPGDNVDEKVKEFIFKNCESGTLVYNPFDAPEFLLKEHPELFLDKDAPDDLEYVFYGDAEYERMNFNDLSENKEWLPYLKKINASPAFIRDSDGRYTAMKQYFQYFGNEMALNLGVSRTEIVNRMIRLGNVKTMKEWYDKTGGKFLPDFVVMENFDINEADKFLTSISYWNRLVKIDRFSEFPDIRDGLLKLAYSFGVFDHDARGFKKLYDLLTGIPTKVNFHEVFKSMDEAGVTLDDLEGRESLNDLRRKLMNTLREEGFELESNKSPFYQVYRQNEDGTCTLTINPQSYPKSVAVLREIFEIMGGFNLLKPEKIHQLCSGFDLNYDPQFREFLLNNLNEIFEHPEYTGLISKIQKQFDIIKSFNSNRRLTLDLAISFVKSNKYAHVNVGNEALSRVSSIAGYSQEDFETLQKMYNYGKQRVFSSIPRIENTISTEHETYYYEILRLDDPLAVAIGTLTNCCQEIGNAAQQCVEHSVVSDFGRVFVVRDKDNNIVAQSWVWRNKDVICFDNIEIPDKAFIRASRNNVGVDDKTFTKEVFEVYKKASKELFTEDNKRYQDLLNQGIITKEQFEGLRLGKVTVGLGNNDIARVIREELKRDKGKLSRPLKFDSPVLGGHLYTDDSDIQYTMFERTDRKESDINTIPIHNDTYIKYDDSNFTKEKLISLERLEQVTKGEDEYLMTSVGDYACPNEIVTEIAINYELNPRNTKIILHPNFAIIYEDKNNTIKIGDLLFNTNIDNNDQQLNIEKAVILQIKLALAQIVLDKNVDISKLNNNQKEMFNKAFGTYKKIEGGESRAR